MNDFYVYCYYEPDVHPEYGLPFYVGKGQKQRAYMHLTGCKCLSNRSYGSIFYRKLRKMLSLGIAPDIEIVMDHLPEDEALTLEKTMIHFIGRRNRGEGPLCNLGSGGEQGGMSGHTHSEETKQKMREAHLGKVFTGDHRKNLSESHRGYKPTKESRRNQAEAQRGRTHSEETKQRIRLAQRRRPISGFDSEGNLVCQFDAIQEAIKGGYTPSCISSCLAGHRKTHRNLVWRCNDA